MEELKNLKARTEHLARGFMPITIRSQCSYHGDKYPMILSNIKSDSPFLIRDSGRIIFNINYYNPSEETLNDGQASYVISPIIEVPRSSTEQLESEGTCMISKGYKICTGLVAVGRSKERGESELAFMTHQDPEKVLPRITSMSHNKFDKAIRGRLLELKESTQEGSIDVIVFGGGNLYGIGDVHVSSTIKSNRESLYRESIDYLRTCINDIFGFEPWIVGPKNIGSNALCDDAIFFPSSRTLYLYRPKGADNNIFVGPWTSRMG